VNTCATNGYAVTAIVVDVSGTPQVLLRGDHATIHTKDSAYKKAYTIVTMGPIFHLDYTSQFFALLSKYPPLAAQSLASTWNVTALPGGAAIKSGDEIVAGIGVGAPRVATRTRLVHAPGSRKFRVRFDAKSSKLGGDKGSGKTPVPVGDCDEDRWPFPLPYQGTLTREASFG
jgi:uncharacterized protein GlcG (DUF336 family)